MNLHGGLQVYEAGSDLFQFRVISRPAPSDMLNALCVAEARAGRLEDLDPDGGWPPTKALRSAPTLA